MNASERRKLLMYLNSLEYYAAVAAGYNMFLNPRRLETPFYALWAYILEKVKESVGASKNSTVLCSSQYPLYVSSSSSAFAPDDPDASMETQADSAARGVAPDLVLLHAVFPTGFVKPRNLSHRIVKERLEALYVPVLLEAKRPPTRHPSNIQRWKASALRLMELARVQVEGQAKCLFSSAQFGEQDSVVLMATTGIWWSWTRIERPKEDTDLWNNKFTEDDLALYGKEGDKDVWATDPDDDDEPVADHENAQLLTPKEAQDQARSLRLARRNEIKSEIEKEEARRREEELKAQSLMYPYTEAQLGDFLEPADSQAPECRVWTKFLSSASSRSTNHFIFVQNFMADFTASATAMVAAN